MGVSLEPWPNWAEQALQGLAFWIGHRHALYRHYPLSEGALVAETCNLIHAHLGDGESLLCEEQYKRLLPTRVLPAGIGSKSRADLVVIDGISAKDAKAKATLAEVAVAVVEVKRYSAPKAQIDYDLQRLAMLKLAVPRIRAFLFVVSEAKRPARFVSPDGRAILGETPIPNSNGHYRVRRACKATAAFSGKETAHYACIIEVS
jgi:hypothetical protein